MGMGGLPGLGGGGGLGGLFGGNANAGMMTGLNGINGSAGGGGGMFSNQNGGLQLSQIPFIGGLFPNPNEGAVRDAFNAAGQSYGGMRGQMGQGYQNIASHFQNQMAPARQALMNMYGGQQGQNSDVTGAIAQQQGPRDSGAAMGAMAGFGGHSPSTASDRATDDGVGGDPLMGFVNTLDPMGGLGSIGGSFGGLFGLNGGQGGPMGAAHGATHGGGILGGLLGGGGGGGGILGGLPGLGGGGLMGL